MAFSLFNFGLGLQGQDSASGVFQGVSARVEDLRETTNSYATRASRAFESIGDVIERRATSALRSFGEGFSDLKADLSSIGDALTFGMGEEFNQQALALTDTTKKLAVQFGEGDAKARMFTDDIVEMSALTGQSIDTFTTLANSLGQAGIDFTSFSKATQGLSEDGRSLKTVWGEQEYLATLIDAFGVAGDEVAEFAQGTKVLGISITDTLDEVTTFQRNFKMPGMIEQVPEATQSAIRAITDFGTEIAGTGKEIVNNTLQMGAVFAKTFGRSMKESVQSAARTMQAFNQESLGFRKIAVGLSTDFSPLVTSFLETGENLDMVRKRMRVAAKDPFGPIKFAEYINTVYSRLKDAGDGLRAERFLIQMREQAPETVRSLISIPGALEAARKEMERVVRFEQDNKGLKTFQEIGEQMWDTGKVALGVFKNLVSLSKTLVGIIFEPVAKDVFGGVGEDLKSFNDKLANLVKMANDTDGAFQKRWKPMLVTAGKGLVAVGTAATLAASAVGALGSAFAIKKGVTTSWSLLARIVPGVGSAGAQVGGVFKGVTKVMGGLAKKVILPVMAFKSLGVALMDMARIFKDPKATGAEKFQAILRGLAVGIGDFIDDFLFGIPSRLTTYFFPELGDSLEQGMGNLVDQGLAKLGTMFSDDNLDMAKEWIGDLFGNAADWLSEVDVEGGTKKVVSAVTTAIVGIGKFSAEMTWGLVTSVFGGLGRWIKSWFSDEVAAPMYTEADVMWGKVADFGLVALQKLSDLGVGILKGMWEGIANASGFHVDVVNAQLENMWLEAQLGVAGFVKDFMDGWDLVELGYEGFKANFTLFIPWLSKIGQEAWAGFAFSATSAFNNAVMSGMESIRGFVSDLAEVASWLDPTGTLEKNLKSVESSFAEFQANAAKDQSKAAEEYASKILDIGKEYDEAARPSRERISAIAAEMRARDKAFSTMSSQTEREILQNDLLAVQAQEAYEKGIKAEKQERKAAAAFRRRKAAETQSRQKEKTAQAEKKGAGRFADLWRMANTQAQDRVHGIRTSLESSGKSGAEVEKAVSEASFDELKRLTKLRRAIKEGDPKVVASAFEDFMKPMAMARSASDSKQAPMATAAPARTRDRGDWYGMVSPDAAPTAPLDNIVDAADGRDRDVTDLANRLSDSGGEKRKQHAEMIERLDAIAEILEQAGVMGAAGMKIKLELDKDKLIKEQRREIMKRSFRNLGVGG